jgi:PAS domain S-box-containing protein
VVRDDLVAELARLAASEVRFRAIFEHAAVGMARAAPDGRWLEVNDRLCQITGYTRDELLTRRVQDIMHPDDLTKGAEQLRRVLAGEVASCERHKRYIRKDGSLVWVACTAALVRRPDGQPDFFIKTVEDITRAKEADTERKQAEEHVKLLLRELNHRAKNLLTVVQALARHTANEVAPEVFAERFGERLAGLAASHDLLVKSDWKGVDIADLVRSQLAHLGELVGTRVTFEGPPLRLSTSAAQAIGMALHELATNAVKFGALSDDAGVVRIAWERYASGGAPHVRLMWSEHDGPLTHPPSRRGFGHTVMVGIVELELGADVRLTYAPSGVVWEMTAPAQRVMEEAHRSGAAQS